MPPSDVPKRSEIWRVDLGYLGKVRPALVLSIPYLDNERALHIVMAHTTSVRGTRFEIALEHPVLKDGVFDAQQVFLVPAIKFERRLGHVTAAQMREVEVVLARILGLQIL